MALGGEYFFFVLVIHLEANQENNLHYCENAGMPALSLEQISCDAVVKTSSHHTGFAFTLNQTKLVGASQESEA